MNNEQTKSCPLKITVHYAECCQNPKNCHYPILGAASDAEAFAKIVSRDHVFFDFQNNYRNLRNFLGTDVAAVDCDNDHSENPDDWITLRQITGIFSNVPFVAYTSRNHMKQKGKKAARPRFHVVFPITRITSAEAYTELLMQLQAYLPVFDENAMDAGRFYFGNPGTKVYFHEGDLPLDAFLEEAALWGGTSGYSATAQKPKPSDKPKPPLLSLETLSARADFGDAEEGDTSPIPEGSRNATLSAIAGKLIKRYGDTQQAREELLQNAARCTPPLPEKELTAIWKSAQKFYEKVKSEQGISHRTNMKRNFKREKNRSGSSPCRSTNPSSRRSRWTRFPKRYGSMLSVSAKAPRPRRISAARQCWRSSPCARRASTGSWASPTG